jgi:thiamine biosynthesis lipoprotein
VPELLLPLFVRATEIADASAGWFEPRIGRLVQLWGFDSPEHNRNAPPSPAEVTEALTRLGATPAFAGETSYGPAPGAAWDMGAIGKGYIAELALSWLAYRGFDHALLNAGGHVAARGRAGQRAWRVGIRDPRPSATELGMIGELTIGDESVVTHGDDQRYFEHAGQRYAHLLDPRTGWPAAGIRSLTVVHADGVLADAGGAALFAAGPDRWRALATRLGLASVLVVTEAGEVLVTDDLTTRIQLSARATS